MRRCGERHHLGAQLGRAPFGRIELRVLLRGVLLLLEHDRGLEAELALERSAVVLQLVDDGIALNERGW